MLIQIECWNGIQEPLHSLAADIRNKVFVNEQQVDPNLEYEHEEESTHYLMFLEGKAIATARYRRTTEGIKMERFAMLKAYRNYGYGSVLLKRVLEDLNKETLPVYLHSQLRAASYYLRGGFKATGAHFFEAGIEHVKMVYTKPLS